ncbi:MAG: lytic transglycosylase, partial [Massilia sp.]|nr:lytic transglycosylase [Massilia sp.]
MFPSKLFVVAILAGSCTLSLSLSAAAQTAIVPAAPVASAAPPALQPAIAPAVHTAVAPAAPDAAARADDELFLLLREAARQDDAVGAASYAARLPNYAIPSYVDYYRLKPRLRNASADEVRDFLQRHQGSAIADRMRNDWLLELGRNRDWANFDQQYPLFVLDDDTQVKCFGLMSRAVRGEKVAPEARALLVNPPGYGDACASLIATLAQAGQFDANDLLAQLRLAGEQHATGPARRAAVLLGATETQAAQAVDVPALAMARGIGSSRIDHEIYLVAIGRMARTSTRL